MAGDHPLPFYDISWLAVKDGDAATLIDLLDFADPIAVTWEQGLAAVCGDYWDFDEPLEAVWSRVFITPNVDGWTLLLGGWFDGHDAQAAARLATTCQNLSQRYGAAHAFTTQGRMDHYAWLLAQNGTILRWFVWDGEVVTDSGETPTVEQQLRAAFVAEESDDVWSPSEVDVCAIAGASGIDPSILGANTSSNGQGVMVTTPWGRQHGVPKRPL